MKMRNYMRRKEKLIDVQCLTTEELIAKIECRKKKKVGAILVPLLILGIAVPSVSVMLSLHGINIIEDDSTNMLSLAAAPVAATTAKKDLISIPTGTVKANPFLPYRDIDDGANVVKDVPKYDLVEPPEIISEGSEAARVMDTVVSGILYDKYSPSAILNIEGNDYLVKKGDVINNYKILNIMQDSVTVMLGQNTYKAGIGEILTEGSINYNDVSNLNKKFGGKNDEM